MKRMGRQAPKFHFIYMGNINSLDKPTPTFTVFKGAK